jgi:hypothetical protein
MLLVTAISASVLAARDTYAFADGDDEVPNPFKAEPLKILPGDSEMRKLLKERYNASLRVVQYRFRQWSFGKATLEVLFEAQRLHFTAQLELADDAKDRVKIYEAFVSQAQEVEKLTKAKFEASMATDADVAEATYWRVDAQIQLLRHKEKASGEKPKSSH